MDEKKRNQQNQGKDEQSSSAVNDGVSHQNVGRETDSNAQSGSDGDWSSSQTLEMTNSQDQGETSEQEDDTGGGGTLY